MNGRVQPLVYVATPVFNGGAYLRECIESVVNQTYSNWVYTIANNCSTDRTLDIAREYAARDPRIHVHNNASFLPVIESFNVGFSLTPPECQYCKLLMADDWLEPECIAEMVRIADAYPSIGLVCTHDGTLTGTDTRPSAPPVPGRDICRETLLGGPSVFGSPTNELIRADLIRNRHPSCNPLNCHGDFEMCFDILQESDFGFIDRILAHNRVHDGSITSRFQSYGTHWFGGLFPLVNYGPMYLSRTEYEERFETTFRGYYHWLARQVGLHREPDFWEFHRRYLQALGYPLDEDRLALAVAEEHRHWVRVDLARRKLAAVVPDSETIILVDDDNWHRDGLTGGRRTMPFLERNGQYWGRPDDDATAIRELERLRQAGAGFIVFAWPAFWWLDHYAGFRDYLHSRYRCPIRNDDVVVFDLTSP